MINYLNRFFKCQFNHALIFYEGHRGLEPDVSFSETESEPQGGDYLSAEG